MSVSPLAGKPAPASMLVDVPKLVAAYYSERPDPAIAAERVSFGTSGHRGSAFARSFNEWHILAIAQALSEYRAANGIGGPLYLGIDTHALSTPAFRTALEVLTANGVEVTLADKTEYTPTPVISHAILIYNRERSTGLADGIVITPSHNPPEDGGFKYNPPNGGPAGPEITSWIEKRANDLLQSQLSGVQRIPFERAMQAPSTHRHNFLDAYVDDLANVIDMDAIHGAGLQLGVDPLGGAGIDYWEPIAARYGLNLTIVNRAVDPTFRFMTVDWDGKIRMDPSSPYAMQSLIGLKDRFDVAFACDPDHDRHGIVAKSVGLVPANHYLAVCIHYLFANRPGWPQSAAVGKTVVSSGMIDRVAEAAGRALYEVPVGFKWYVEGLLAGALGFAGEESAGSSFLRKDGTVWTTEKDGFIATLLAAEMTARTGRDPGEIYRGLTARFGEPAYARLDGIATAGQKAILENLSPADIQSSELAGDPIRRILTKAPGNGGAIGGVKVIADEGWFAARPSGTEEVYKIYAESFRGPEHLERIEREARAIVAQAFAAAQGVRPAAI
ncbi:MAG: phosphoglucomutase (alpha-D-glucose-1,6-bisphosphate-dependent) [Bryobacteraceae bacterium]